MDQPGRIPRYRVRRDDWIEVYASGTGRGHALTSGPPSWHRLEDPPL